MSEKSISITEKDGKYQVRNNGVSEFELIGILECVLSDLKSVNRKLHKSEEPPINCDEPQYSPPAKETEAKNQPSSTPDLRTRIGNAVKAIKSLGGEVGVVDINKLSDDELQAELDELTNQYKRLKTSKPTAK